MGMYCQVTGKKPLSGHNVSHSNVKTKRRFYPNLQWKRFWLPNEKRWVRLRVSTHGMKIIDRRGITKVVAEMRARGEKIS
jgi:large subunit ribosomal protein L28